MKKIYSIRLSKFEYSATFYVKPSSLIVLLNGDRFTIHAIPCQQLLVLP